MLYILPILLAVAIFALLFFLKKRMDVEKFRRLLLIIAGSAAVLSIAATIASFVISGKKESLFKISMPAFLLVLVAMMAANKRRNKGNDVNKN